MALTEVYIDDLLGSVEGRRPGDISDEEKNKILNELNWRRNAAKLGIDPYTGPMMAAPSEEPPLVAEEIFATPHKSALEPTGDEVPIVPLADMTGVELLERQQAHEHASDQARFDNVLRAAGAVGYGGWRPISGS